MPCRPQPITQFVKSNRLLDERIEHRRKVLEDQRAKLARAKQAAASAAPSPAPAAAAASASGTPVAQDTPRSAVPAIAVPTPVATPPLHPSLPAKPGTVAARPPPVHEPAAPAIVAPKPTPAPAPAPPPPVVVPPAVLHDDLIAQYEEQKAANAWVALRATRDQYLQHFGKIDGWDIHKLDQEIENEQKAAREAAANPVKDDRGTSPLASSQSTVSLGIPDKTDRPVTPEAESKDPAATEEVKMET